MHKSASFLLVILDTQNELKYRPKMYPKLFRSIVFKSTETGPRRKVIIVAERKRNWLPVVWEALL